MLLLFKAKQFTLHLNVSFEKFQTIIPLSKKKSRRPPWKNPDATLLTTQLQLFCMLYYIVIFKILMRYFSTRDTYFKIIGSSHSENDEKDNESVRTFDTRIQMYVTQQLNWFWLKTTSADSLNTKSPGTRTVTYEGHDPQSSQWKCLWLIRTRTGLFLWSHRLLVGVTSYFCCGRRRWSQLQKRIIDLNQTSNTRQKKKKKSCCLCTLQHVVSCSSVSLTNESGTDSICSCRRLKVEKDECDLWSGSGKDARVEEATSNRNHQQLGRIHER